MSHRPPIHLLKIIRKVMKKKLLTIAVALLGFAGAALAQAKETIDLSPIGVPATMQAPKGVKAVEESYSYYINGLPNFNITVENTSMDLAGWKEKVKNDDLNTFIKFVETSDNGFIYECKIMGRVCTHFEYIATIGGQKYRFYDKRVSPLTLAQVKPMYEAAKTIKGK